MAKRGTTPVAAMGKVLGWLAQLTALLFACHSAFTIRTFAIEGYGRLIHECVAPRSRAAGGRCAAGLRRVRLAELPGAARARRFDPWFNFRATQYLFDNGVSARPRRCGGARGVAR